MWVCKHCGSSTKTTYKYVCRYCYNQLRQLNPEFIKSQQEYKKKYYQENKVKAKADNKVWLQRTKEQAKIVGWKCELCDSNDKGSYKSLCTTCGWKRYKNSDKGMIKKKEYYEKNKDKAKIWFKRWTQRNHEYYKLSTRLKEHKRRTIYGAGNVKVIDWLKIRNSSPMCPMCGRWVGCENLTIDHIVPISKGGEHTIVNIQAICRKCNVIKRDKIYYYLDIPEDLYKKALGDGK
jgi:5-methylcytosine-specific restriction endonuclease McrA